MSWLREQWGQRSGPGSTHDAPVLQVCDVGSTVACRGEQFLRVLPQPRRVYAHAQPLAGQGEGQQRGLDLVAGLASVGVCWDAVQLGGLHWRPYRKDTLIVSNFEAALRVVRAGLAISVVPREVAARPADTLGLRLVTLDQDWADRRFIICYRDPQVLSPAAQLLVEHLAALAPA
jgi:DNA-binding transcriptional LysR family regulator